MSWAATAMTCGSSDTSNSLVKILSEKERERKVHPTLKNLAFVAADTRLWERNRFRRHLDPEASQTTVAEVMLELIAEMERWWDERSGDLKIIRTDYERENVRTCVRYLGPSSHEMRAGEPVQSNTLLVIKECEFSGIWKSESMLIRLIYFFILNSVLATSAARVYGGGGGGGGDLGLTWGARNSSRWGERRSRARTSLTCARGSIPGGRTWVRSCTRQMSCPYFKRTYNIRLRRPRGQTPALINANITADMCHIFIFKDYQMVCSWWRASRVPEVLHALSQPLQQELDVLRDVLVVILLLFQVLQLLQHLTLDHGQSVLLPGLPLCRLLQEILEQTADSRLKKSWNTIVASSVLYIH